MNLKRKTSIIEHILLQQEDKEEGGEVLFPPTHPKKERRGKFVSSCTSLRRGDGRRRL